MIIGLWDILRNILLENDKTINIVWQFFIFFMKVVLESLLIIALSIFVIMTLFIKMGIKIFLK